MWQKFTEDFYFNFIEKDRWDGVVTSVLIGASRPAQILENLKVLNSAPFTEEELKKIDQCALSL